MMGLRRVCTRRGVLEGATAIATAWAAVRARAQTPLSNPLHALSRNRDKPLKIEGALIEVRPGAGVAVYGDNVRVALGDTTMKCPSLTVYYEQEEGVGDIRAADPSPSGAMYIRKLEAAGGVIITHQDQTAVGETGVLDVRSNLASLSGNVVLTLGHNILRGGRLMVNLATGESRMEPSGPIRF